MRDTAAVYEFLKERLGVDIRSTEASTELASLGGDSLLLLELVYEIEERSGVEVDEGTPLPRTCGEMVALIDRHAAARP